MIQEGLLWFDDNPHRTMTDKLARAVQRYQQKYGHNPDVCYVNPAPLNGQDLSTDTVKVVPAKSVLPYHFWLGIYKKANRLQINSG